MIVLTAGPFGRAVGERIAARRSAELLPLPDSRHALRSIAERTDFIGVASWRPYVETFRRLDTVCFETGTRWSLVEIHDTRLSCGPLVWPGAGACHHCYRQRWSSHHPAPERELVLAQAYERDPDLGIAGFIAPLVDIAASALLEDADAAANAAGRLRVVDVLTGAVLETEVIGIHRCPRCRPHPPGPSGERFVRDLVPAVEALLK